MAKKVITGRPGPCKPQQGVDPLLIHLRAKGVVVTPESYLEFAYPQSEQMDAESIDQVPRELISGVMQVSDTPEPVDDAPFTKQRSD